MNTPARTAQSSAPADRRPAALWLTAAALLALVLIIAGRAPFGADPAVAISNDRAGDMAALTVGDGSGQDVVIVLDRVKGMALVYTIVNRQELVLQQAEPIERLFSQARAFASAQRPSP